MEETPMNLDELRSSLLAKPKTGYQEIPTAQLPDLEAYAKR